MASLNAIFKAVKDKFASTGSLSSLVARTSFGKASEKLEIEDGPYAVTSLQGNDVEFAYNSDTSGVDTYRVQISVYGTSLSSVATLTETISGVFQGVRLSLASGTMVHARRLNYGLLSDPNKSKSGKSIYHSFVVFEFIVHN